MHHRLCLFLCGAVMALSFGCGGRPLARDGGSGTDTPIADLAQQNDQYTDMGSGCLQNTQCAPRHYCKLHDACKGPGSCTKIPDGCNLLHDPVCGCDGKTHGNACAAAAAGISVAHRGDCQVLGPCHDDEGCPAASFCLFETGCGKTRGLCTVRPVACEENYDPVCGCNGQTFSNACAAHGAGISVASSGPCAPDQCANNGQCKKGQFCNKDKHCGESSAFSGRCEWLPSGCNKKWDPVCGCDGKTHGNSCLAHLAGVSVRTPGPCNKVCQDIQYKYAHIVDEAKRCAPMGPAPQCKLLVENALPCGCPTYINQDITPAVDILSKEWEAAGCNKIPQPCPDCIPRPNSVCDPATARCVGKP